MSAGQRREEQKQIKSDRASKVFPWLREHLNHTLKNDFLNSMLSSMLGNLIFNSTIDLRLPKKIGRNIF
jgi:hypothetical protein